MLPVLLRVQVSSGVKMTVAFPILFYTWLLEEVCNTAGRQSTVSPVSGQQFVSSVKSVEAQQPLHP